MNTQKIFFLLPPSEGKNTENSFETESLSFVFPKPFEILENATEKDLKCKGERFTEATKLNQTLQNQNTQEAIKRYSGVMYNAISYESMTEKAQNFFEEKFIILSGLYGIVKPKDKIANYKLPIETKGLYDFWGEQIIETLAKEKSDYIVNLLPMSYAKLIGIGTKKVSQDMLGNTKIININFLKSDGKKISHGVKKIKGEFIKGICEKGEFDYTKFSDNMYEKGNSIDVNIFQSI